jgi:hypothetical protein
MEKRSWLKWFLNPLMNQRGEINIEGDPPADPPADAPESIDPPAEGDPPAGPSKTEPPATPSADDLKVAENQGFQIKTDDKGRQYIVDEDGAEIPPKRFKEIYHGAKEGERTKEKFDLFKRLGPEAYYKAYPDEKPADYVDPNKPAEPAPTKETISSLKNRVISGGKYDGWTLADVYQDDAFAALEIIDNYNQSKAKEAEAVRAQQARDEEGIKEKTQEGNLFMWDRAKELFKKDGDYTPEEIKQVQNEYKTLGDWMRSNKKLHYSLKDAYQLMTMNTKINDAKNNTAKNVVDSLRKQPVGHINGGPGTVSADNYEALTEAQLAETVDKMSDEKKAEFYAKATPALRRKYPSWPWD